MYAILRRPKTITKATKKSNIRMSPETFETVDKAQAYIDEYERRRFLTSDDLVIVELKEISSPASQKGK